MLVQADPTDLQGNTCNRLQCQIIGHVVLVHLLEPGPKQARDDGAAHRHEGGHVQNGLERGAGRVDDGESDAEATCSTALEQMRCRPRRMSPLEHT
jgi:hypothetical protein